MTAGDDDFLKIVTMFYKEMKSMWEQDKQAADVALEILNISTRRGE